MSFRMITRLMFHEYRLVVLTSVAIKTKICLVGLFQSWETLKQRHLVQIKQRKTLRSFKKISQSIWQEIMRWKTSLIITWGRYATMMIHRSKEFKVALTSWKHLTVTTKIRLRRSPCSKKVRLSSRIKRRLASRQSRGSRRMHSTNKTSAATSGLPWVPTTRTWSTTATSRRSATRFASPEMSCQSVPAPSGRVSPASTSCTRSTTLRHSSVMRPRVPTLSVHLQPRSSRHPTAVNRRRSYSAARWQVTTRAQLSKVSRHQ